MFMVHVKKIIVEVAYAKPDVQKIFSVEVDEDATIEEVISLSGMLTFFPEIDLARQKIGIFSKAKKLTDTVKAGDRIEIYRTLVMDPKEARRKRVKKS